MVLFKGLGSRHTRNLLFDFSPTTSPLNQTVGFWTGSMISKLTIRFNSFSYFGLKARGIFLTGVTAGVSLSLILIWWVFFTVPISPKQSENLNKTCSSLTFTVEKRFIKFRLSLVANPRIDRDLESTTIKKTSKLFLLCFRVSENFPSMRITL